MQKAILVLALLLLQPSFLFPQVAGSPIDSLPVIFHGSRNEKKIALTFDACPAGTIGGYDSLITKVLIETETPATFFLSGRWMRNHARETQFLASIPYFVLGNHSYSHPHLEGLPDSRIRNEIQRTQDELYRLTGKRATLFRPPYGEYDERIVQIVRRLALQTVQFDLASGDPDTNISKERLSNYVVKSMKNGSIIVMHINGRGKYTAAALPGILRRLRERGFMFVTINELHIR